MTDPTREDPIWKSIVGTKGHLSSARIENLSNILERVLGLKPIMVRYGDRMEAWAGREAFMSHHIAMRRDGWCSLYYHPKDCEAATGSRSGNFLSWANSLLRYGRKSHSMAPYTQPPLEAVQELVRRGALKDMVTRTRLLSLELVCYYLAAQTSTWENPGRIIRVKDLMGQQGVKVFPPDPEDSEDDIFEIISSSQVTTHKRPPVVTSLPKKAQVLVGYNPTKPQEPGIKDMSLDEIQRQIAKLQAEAARKMVEQKQQFLEQAKKGRFFEGEVWEDRPQWKHVRIAFPDGSAAFYYHEDLLQEDARGQDADPLALSS